MDAPRTLGQVIRSRRLALGLTQEELAERIGNGVRQAEVSRLECDRVALPRRQRLVRLAAALEVSVGELLASAGWAGADEAFHRSDPAVLDPPRSIPDLPALASPATEDRRARRADVSAPLWAAIERSRALQQRTNQLLEISAALAASWWAGETRRHPPRTG